MRFISILLIPLFRVVASPMELNMATMQEAPLGPFVMYTPAEKVPDPLEYPFHFLFPILTRLF